MEICSSLGVVAKKTFPHIIIEFNFIGLSLSLSFGLGVGQYQHTIKGAFTRNEIQPDNPTNNFSPLFGLLSDWMGCGPIGTKNSIL